MSSFGSSSSRITWSPYGEQNIWFTRRSSSKWAIKPDTHQRQKKKTKTQKIITFHLLLTKGALYVIAWRGDDTHVIMLWQKLTRWQKVTIFCSPNFLLTHVILPLLSALILLIINHCLLKRNPSILEKVVHLVDL